MLDTMFAALGFSTEESRTYLALLESGPVAGGGQLMPWVHADDVAGIYLRAIDDAAWSGPVNATAPRPVTNKAFSTALGRALHRPALAPVPAFAIQLLYGDMSEIVTKGQNAWIKNPAEEPQAIATMSKAQNVTVSATSARGNKTGDRYSLAGFAQALDRAKKECP